MRRVMHNYEIKFKNFVSDTSGIQKEIIEFLRNRNISAQCFHIDTRADFVVLVTRIPISTDDERELTRSVCTVAGEQQCSGQVLRSDTIVENSSLVFWRNPDDENPRHRVGRYLKGPSRRSHVAGELPLADVHQLPRLSKACTTSEAYPSMRRTDEILNLFKDLKLEPVLYSVWLSEKNDDGVEIYNLRLGELDLREKSQRN